MPTLWRDLKHAVRLLARNPMFTVVVVLTLTLGIGLNTAVFSAIDSLLLRPLPGVSHPEELVQIYRTWPGGDRFSSSSPAHYFDIRNRSKDVFSDVAAWSFETVSLSISGRAERLVATMVSANYFSTFGVPAERGRTFIPEEDIGEGAHPVVVLSHATWKGMFGADPNVVGRTVLLNGETYTVIGVAAERFRGAMPIVSPPLWVPIAQMGQIRRGGDTYQTRNNNFLTLVARLAPGVTVATATQRVNAIMDQLLAEYPGAYRQSGMNLVPQTEAGIHPTVRSAQVGLSAIVMAVVVMLLLIACVNVANLLIARARERSREMAIRLGLGASRGTIIRQLLTESLLLALVAGVSGVGLAWWVIGIVNRVRFPVSMSLTPGLEISRPVLWFTLLLSIGTGLLFGLVPAFQTSRPALIPALKGEAPAGGSRSRLSRGLVVTQIALSIILLISAGLFLRNLRAATMVYKGFVSDHLLIADLDPGLQGYNRSRTADFYSRLLERLRAIPAVASVGMSSDVQLGLGGSDWSVEVPGYTPAPNEGMTIHVSVVTPRYFDALGTPLVAGRAFTPADDSSSAHVAVVNQRFADRFWPGQDPLGRVFRTGGSEHTVVGVVPTGKYQRLGEDPLPFMFMPQAQHWRSGMSVHIRTKGEPRDVIPLLKAEVAALDADLPVSDIRTMDQHLNIALLPARLAGLVLGVFGVLGLLLASIGIYGVMAGAVSQRTKEIGIRIAIGAAGVTVVRLLLREGMTLVALGIAIGVGGALVASRAIGAMLYTRNGLDPVTFLSVPIILGGVALLAIWLPARRASAVDPVIALRRE